MNIELISFSLCPFVQRSAIVLLEKGVEFKTTYIDLANKPDWFLEISPTGKVPLLKVNGHVIFESNVINEYLDEALEPRLHPADLIRRAQHRAWMAFANELFSYQYGFLYGMTEADHAKATADLLRAFEKLEPEIVGPYFNGDNYSLVDASYAPLFMRFQMFQEQSKHLFKTKPNLQKWSDALVKRPSTDKSVSATFDQEMREYLLKKESYLGKVAFK